MSRSSIAAILSAALIALSSMALARGAGNDDWAPLFADERERIDIIDLQPKLGRFKQIRIQAVNAPIFVSTVVINIAGGKSREYQIKQSVPKGGYGTPIDLPGDKQVLRSAEIRYKANMASGAYIMLHGLIADDPGGFTVLESKVINTKEDEVRIRVDGGEEPVSAIKLRAWVDTLIVRSAEIEFGDRSRQRVRIRERLEPGEATDPIDLENIGHSNKRFVRSVILRLRPQRGQADKARIDVLGKTARRFDKRHRGRNKLGRGWNLLGTRTASFTGDSDVIKIGKPKGRFRAIRVRSLKNDVKMYSMTIIYGNGKREEVPVNGTLEEGQLSQPFDLKGRSRYIEEIRFRYRSKLSIGGQAKVELWGLEN